jgi:flagellar biosynthesis regulator FlbT
MILNNIKIFQEQQVTLQFFQMNVIIAHIRFEELEKDVKSRKFMQELMHLLNQFQNQHLMYEQEKIVKDNTEF